MTQQRICDMQFSGAFGCNGSWTQSSLLVSFVSKPKLSTKPFYGNADNRINTGDCRLRLLSDWPPKHHVTVAFLQVRKLGLLSPIRFTAPTAAKSNRRDRLLTARRIWLGQRPSDLQMKPSSPYRILKARIEENRRVAHY